MRKLNLSLALRENESVYVIYGDGRVDVSAVYISPLLDKERCEVRITGLGNFIFPIANIVPQRVYTDKIRNKIEKKWQELKHRRPWVLEEHLLLGWDWR